MFADHCAANIMLAGCIELPFSFGSVPWPCVVMLGEASIARKASAKRQQSVRKRFASVLGVTSLEHPCKGRFWTIVAASCVYHVHLCNCRRFRSVASSSHVKTANGHRDVTPPGCHLGNKVSSLCEGHGIAARESAISHRNVAAWGHQPCNCRPLLERRVFISCEKCQQSQARAPLGSPFS